MADTTAQAPVRSENEQAHDKFADTASAEQVANAFKSIVNGDGREHGLRASSTTEAAYKHPWLQRLIPGIENFANSYHIGNFVATTRGPNPEKTFEAMPIYARLGMHLLFYGRAQTKLLHTSRVEGLFKEQSIKQGRLFDSTEHALEQIEGFVKEYDLARSLDQLEKPNLKDYKTFNEFFSRELKPDARPIDGADDPSIIVSAADCRLTVFDSVSSAKALWVKDRAFTVPTLLDDPELAKTIGDEPSVAIFRLAPADYHRWRSPIDGTLGTIKHLPGQYYTVNPQAVNEDFAVFTANRRDVTQMSWSDPSGNGPPTPVALVAVGALLVGSISWLKAEGSTFKKGESQGYFSYGGSTVIALFPKGYVVFDDDLLTNSRNKLETKVSACNHIGRRVSSAAP